MKEFERKLLFKINSYLQAKDLPIYLVGGSVRDELLKRPVKDYDFFVPGLGQEMAEKLANFLGARFMLLDAEHEMFRILFWEAEAVFQIDLEGGLKNLVDNLSRRDFTINSLALTLEDYLNESEWESKIIDPLNGMADLKKLRLRLCSEDSLQNDPIRILRAFRLTSILGLRMTEETEFALKKESFRLQDMPGERIWAELVLVLALEDAAFTLEQMQKKGEVFTYLCPDCPGNERIAEVWEKSLRLLAGLEADLESKDAVIFLGSEGERDYVPVFKLAVLISKLKVEEALKVASRLKLGNKKQNFLKTLLEQEEVAYLILESKTEKSDEILRDFYERVGLVMPWSLFLAWGKINLEKRDGKIIREIEERLRACLLWFEAEKKQQKEIIPYLNGQEICGLLELEPGPKVGQIIKQLRRKQLAREIKSKAEATEWVKERG